MQTFYAGRGEVRLIALSVVVNDYIFEEELLLTIARHTLEGCCNILTQSMSALLHRALIHPDGSCVEGESSLDFPPPVGAGGTCQRPRGREIAARQGKATVERPGTFRRF
jgi:hypothetical protein